MNRLACTALVAAYISCAAPAEETRVADEGTAVDSGAPAPSIAANNLFWYYADLEAATRFYTRALGLELIADYGFAKILRIAGTSYLTLVDEERGMHSSDEPKTVALALVTDQLDAWWTYLSDLGVPMRSGYDPAPGSPHHGFVAIDPEGYLLEFERFNPHPENAQFVPLLDVARTLPVGGDAGDAVGDLGFKATVTWLYYRDIPRMERLYEDLFGLEMIVDQGLAKIYGTSPTGFIGLVDESRGMHRYTEDKAVTVSFLTHDLDAWFARAGEGALELRSDGIETGNPRYRAFVAYDPEGYFIEFDTFLEHEDNADLLASVRDGVR